LKIVNLLIIGFGTIGRGVAETLVGKREFIRRNFDADIRVVGIAEINGSIIDENGINLSEILKLAENGRLEEHPKWTSRKARYLIRNLDIDITLELTPGDMKTGEPGLRHITESLERGIHVVTSNKAPLALKFSELSRIADENNVQLRYEATVGGAIPIINLYRNCLQINRINSIYGILNGTSNYILTRMFEELVDLEVALNDAIELGIAEKNPEYDIYGIDTGAKITILANSLMNRDISINEIEITGIQEIGVDTLEIAKKHGYTIKLIGDVNELEVSPRLIPINHPLNISGVLNAIMLHTDVANKITIIGHGAGKIETCSSIFSDIIAILDKASMLHNYNCKNLHS